MSAFVIHLEGMDVVNELKMVIPTKPSSGYETISAVVSPVLLREAAAEIESLRASQFRWIPLEESHPASRFGTAKDAEFLVLDARGNVSLWKGSTRTVTITHWAPIPPLPEKSQEEKDEELWVAYCRSKDADLVWTRKGAPLHDCFVAGLKAAREQKP